jgi:hypothetical protein
VIYKSEIKAIYMNGQNAPFFKSRYFWCCYKCDVELYSLLKLKSILSSFVVDILMSWQFLEKECFGSLPSLFLILKSHCFLQEVHCVVITLSNKSCHPTKCLPHSVDKSMHHNRRLVSNLLSWVIFIELQKLI